MLPTVGPNFRAPNSSQSQASRPASIRSTQVPLVALINALVILLAALSLSESGSAATLGAPLAVQNGTHNKRAAAPEAFPLAYDKLSALSQAEPLWQAASVTREPEAQASAQESASVMEQQQQQQEPDTQGATLAARLSSNPSPFWPAPLEASPRGTIRYGQRTGQTSGRYQNSGSPVPLNLFNSIETAQQLRNDGQSAERLGTASSDEHTRNNCAEQEEDEQQQQQHGVQSESYDEQQAHVKHKKLLEKKELKQHHKHHHHHENLKKAPKLRRQEKKLAEQKVEAQPVHLEIHIKGKIKEKSKALGKKEQHQEMDDRQAKVGHYEEEQIEDQKSLLAANDDQSAFELSSSVEAAKNSGLVGEKAHNYRATTINTSQVPNAYYEEYNDEHKRTDEHQNQHHEAVQLSAKEEADDRQKDEEETATVASHSNEKKGHIKKKKKKNKVEEEQQVPVEKKKHAEQKGKKEKKKVEEVHHEEGQHEELKQQEKHEEEFQNEEKHHEEEKKHEEKKVEEKKENKKEEEEKKEELVVKHEKHKEEKKVTKKHKHAHIELHQHKHFEQHHHINLTPEHQKQQEHGHEEDEEMQHYHGQQHAPEVEHHETPIINEEEMHHPPTEHHQGNHNGGIGHQFGHEQPLEMMGHQQHQLLNEHHGHGEHIHEPEHHVPIKEHWQMVAPVLHEKPPSQQHKFGTIVIEDHSLMDEHDQVYPESQGVHYNEEVIGNPHGIGLTPLAAHNLMSAYSSPKALHASKNASQQEEPADAAKVADFGAKKGEKSVVKKQNKLKNGQKENNKQIEERTTKKPKNLELFPN